MNKLQSEFINPPTKYRPVPFWSWNDLLEDKELARQIHEMKKNGLGGYFMHARVGLETPYMSNDWMKRVNTGIKTGKKYEMEAWLYDEDKWPSGFAGGVIPRKGEKYREKCLVCSENSELGDNFSLLAVFSLNNEGKFSKPGSVPENSSGKILRFYRWVEPLGNPWFNGTSYVDNLNPEVVDAFIKSTYTPYAKLFKENFKREVPGVFTDEPCYMMYNYSPKPSLPWTDKFPEIFKSNAGYDLLDMLPCLFYEVANYEKVRYDFFKLITQQFINSYSKKIYRWCEENELIYTGHYMAEQNLCSQIQWIGSAMPHYEYMSYPGIDHLGRAIKGQLITVKQVSSVADQLGKKRTLSETYGCSGWNMSFEDQKWISEWQIALGINLINPHLSLYSSRGSRKRDYPPSLFYQQPWWDQYSIINDYLARLCAMMSKGDRKCDILVIHPMETGWITYNPRNSCTASKYSADFDHICEHLLSIQRDFHLGDENILERHGVVAEANLELGNGSYHVIIVPPLLTLREKTVNLLKSFQEGGGHLVFVENLPAMIEGKHSNLIEEYFDDCKIVSNNRLKIRDYLDYILPRNISLISDDGDNPKDIVIHHREIDFNDVIFLVNTARDKSYKTRLSVAGSGSMQKWDPYDGSFKDLKVEIKDELFVTNLKFEPSQSHLLFLNRQGEPKTYKKKEKEITRTIKLGKKYKMKIKGDNSITLDHCRLKVEDGQWSDFMYVMDANEEAHKNGDNKNVFFKYVFNSDIGSDKAGDIFAAVECPDNFKIYFNNKLVKYTNNGWWTDIAFKKVLLPELLKKGNNSIIFETKLKSEHEIESVYICGKFGVNNRDNKEFSLCEPGNSYTIGDLTKQGYPFFRGKAVITEKVQIIPKGNESIFLKLKSMDAIISNIKVNGYECGGIVWHPLSVEITEFIQPGNNKIEIEMVGSCRNLLGPHHHNKRELIYLGPEHFNDKEHWTDEYQFMPFGLLDEPEIKFYTME